MLPLFKLVKKEFTEEEWRWTYSCLIFFAFNKEKISEITITDHYQKEHSEITNKLILSILQTNLNGERRDPRKKHGKRNIFVEERISYQGKKYRLIFWFKDGITDHLWIRNCYPMD